MDAISSAPRVDPLTPATAADERSYFNITQAAALLGVSRVSVWRWIRDGRLPVLRLGHRTTRIKREDLERIRGLNGSAQNGHVGPRSWKLPNPSATDAAAQSAALSSDWREIGASEHVVQFYEADETLLDAVADYIGTALREGNAGIVIATPEHRAALEERFQASGLDVPAARDRGQYAALDAAETLATFMVDGAPETERFVRVIGDVIARAAEDGRHVRAFGEMVALLAVDGKHAAAIRLEELWNDLQKMHAFSLFCAYPMKQLGGEAIAAMLGDVCAEHSHVIPAESFTTLSTPDERLRAIALLQQKATWLEAEVAERKRAEEQLRLALLAEQAARAAAEEALRLRDEFLSVAAHELRTPLTSLLGYAQLFLKRLTRDGQAEPESVALSLRAITGQAAKLGHLVNQLLDVSRLEAGKLTLDRRPVDLTSLVRQVVADARVRSDRHVITLEAPASLEARVDSLRLEQVLTNLLENAVKYSPDGGPIEISLVQTGRGVVELSVRDRGLGIPPEKRGQIFQRFYQAHDPSSLSGMGLGLYISLQIVELHDGEIRAEFPPDGGTRFVVRLPVEHLPTTLNQPTVTQTAPPAAFPSTASPL